VAVIYRTACDPDGGVWHAIELVPEDIGSILSNLSICLSFDPNYPPTLVLTDDYVELGSISGLSPYVIAHPTVLSPSAPTAWMSTPDGLVLLCTPFDLAHFTIWMGTNGPPATE
jgi:hypothetical protein